MVTDRLCIYHYVMNTVVSPLHSILYSWGNREVLTKYLLDLLICNVFSVHHHIVILLLMTLPMYNNKSVKALFTGDAWKNTVLRVGFCGKNSMR